MASIVVAVSNATQNNLRSALGAQLFRLWMYDPRETLTKLQADRKRILCEWVTYRGSDYTRLY